MSTQKDMKYWVEQIRIVEKNTIYSEWKRQAKELFKLYRNQTSESSKTAKYNLLYRNIKVKMPFLVPFIPSVVVERQNQDNDPVARVASEMLERICSKMIEQDNIKQVLDRVKLDAELAGFGQIWLNYTVAETEKGFDENIEFEYLSCFDYLHNTASRVEDITWVGKRCRLTKEAFKKKYPEYIDSVQFSSDKSADTNLWNEPGVDARDSNTNMITLWEIWDKIDRKVYVFAPISNKTNEVLEEKDYPLDIDFPCNPLGLMFDDYNDNLIPTPRHSQCIAQYKKINELTNEIFEITPSIRVCGAYDESLEDIDKIFDINNKNSLIPIKNAAKYIEKGGLDGAIAWYNPAAAISALQSLNAERDLLIKDVQNMLGVYDVLEGETNPNEAFGTNKLKGTFGTQRLQEDQSKIIFFAQDVLRIACDMICQLFEPETLFEKSNIGQSTENQALILPALEMLSDKRLTNTRLEISAEEIHAYCDESYKINIAALWGKVFDMLASSAQMIQTTPEMAPICKVAIMSTVRTYRVGRTIENNLETAIDNAMAKYTENQTNKQPTPEMLIAQAEIKKAEAQIARAQTDAQRLGVDSNDKSMQHERRFAVDSAKIRKETEKLQADVVLSQERLAHDINIDNQKLFNEERFAEADLELKRQAEQRKQAEILAETELAWYSVNHPEINNIPTIGIRS